MILTFPFQNKILEIIQDPGQNQGNINIAQNPDLSQRKNLTKKKARNMRNPRNQGKKARVKHNQKTLKLKSFDC